MDYKLSKGSTERSDCKVEILAGSVSKAYIHLLVSASPYLSVSKLMQYIKGTASRKLLMEYKEWNQQFWGSICGQKAFCGERRECYR